MKHRRIQTIKVANKVVTKDSEGVPNVSYGEPMEFKGEVWPATSKLAVDTYGERVNAIMNVKIRGIYTVVRNDNGVLGYAFDDFEIREGDGVCIESDVPGYRIVSIKPYKPLKLEVERL